MRRVARIAWELGGVLPRSVGALTGAGDWRSLSVTGLRQLGEVTLDELVVTGMTLTGPPPQLPRPLDDYCWAAEELETLGIDGAHIHPESLDVKHIRPRRFGALTFDELVFDHEPALPASVLADGHGGVATARVRLYRRGDDDRPWVVWVHGAGQGDPMDLLVARVRRLSELGFNVALPVQPGHGARRRFWPEYPARDPLANVAGMMRAVSELRALIGWLEPQASSIAVAGLSLGSAVAALVSHLDARVDAVALYTPILGLNTMIGMHLGRWGSAGQQSAQELQSATVAAMTSVIDPLRTRPSTDRRLIVGAWHDRMAMRDSALAMHEQWGGELYWHDGSHVGHLFSGAVQTATERFLTTVA
ncbi:alpha/beta hydrolase [Mycolicibacterium farcinogenes]|uniref:alpha/beta hydrolase n=1 Tax=Mycolicibacterium farcinogenes TaxID=1802 RepID=UPI001C8ED302|nr:alpha/beta hydrolase [Mycolicibacterium farcinogenes]QZH58392.1 alpha/beta hydrolase [Mycolicibacterium farcinogenes]